MKSRLTGWWPGSVAAGLIAAAVALAGCAGSASPAAPGSPAPAGTASAGQHVTISGTSGLRFMPMTVHVHTGTVRITLRDMGAYPHNVVIPGLGATSATVTGDPGSSDVSFQVTFTHAGRYPFHCQYHQSAGMTGLFVVS